MAGTVVTYDAIINLQTAVQGLSLVLPGGGTLPTTRVYARKILTDCNVTLPCVIIALGPMPPVEEPGLNLRDDWDTPLIVAIVAAGNQNYALDSETEALLLWEQRTRRLVNNVRVTGTYGDSTLKQCRWQPWPVAQLGLWETANLWVQGGFAHVITREPRTT